MNLLLDLDEIAGSVSAHKEEAGEIDCPPLLDLPVWGEPCLNNLKLPEPDPQLKKCKRGCLG